MSDITPALPITIPPTLESERQAALQACYHEAGHSVIGAALGGHLLAVSGQPHGNCGGVTFLDWNFLHDSNLCPNGLKRLVYLFAGLAAQERCVAEMGLQKSDNDGGGSDRQMAFEDCKRILGIFSNSEMVGAAFEFAKREAEQMVQKHWARIVKLAEILMAVANLGLCISTTDTELADLQRRFLSCINDAGWRASVLSTPCVASDVIPPAATSAAPEIKLAACGESGESEL